MSTCEVPSPASGSPAAGSRVLRFRPGASPAEAHAWQGVPVAGYKQPADHQRVRQVAQRQHDLRHRIRHAERQHLSHRCRVPDQSRPVARSVNLHEFSQLLRPPAGQRCDHAGAPIPERQRDHVKRDIANQLNHCDAFVIERALEPRHRHSHRMHDRKAAC